jgi:peroxiredoxin/predicted 2-oxoglutarate/Fe(II)-dependent dioxygenase YbiX
MPLAVEAGDIAPNAALPDQLGRSVTLNGLRYAGRPLGLVFPGSPVSEPLLAALAGLFPELAAAGSSVAAVSPLSVKENAELIARLGLPFDVLSDADGKFRKTYAPGHDRAVSYVLGRNFRVRHVEGSQDSGDHARRLGAALREGAADPEPRPAPFHAPVLVVPDVLEPGLCARLVVLWQGENAVAGFTRKEGGQSVTVHDESVKVRRDHDIHDAEILAQLNHRFSRRLMPEIFKAFRFRVREAEHFRVACYESADGGHFAAHRDNTSPGTARRQFAMSLNLNAGEYEGGFLRFPEYGPDFYMPETGCAVVFSCSLLHEALAVTRGRRFALLSFFL